MRHQINKSIRPKVKNFIIDAFVEKNLCQIKKSNLITLGSNYFQEN